MRFDENLHERTVGKWEAAWWFASGLKHAGVDVREADIVDFADAYRACWAVYLAEQSSHMVSMRQAWDVFAYMRGLGS